MFPVLSHQFVLYLQHVATESHSKSAVEEAVHAISWVQQIVGYNNIGQDTMVIKVVLSGLQRDLAKLKVKKEPVTLDMLRKMAETAGTAPSLTDSRLLAIALLAFAAFLRFSEIVNLCCNDIVFHPGHFFKCIKDKTGQITPKWFMTDDASQYYNAWTTIFGASKHTSMYLACRQSMAKGIATDK